MLGDYRHKSRPFLGEFLLVEAMDHSLLKSLGLIMLRGCCYMALQELEKLLWQEKFQKFLMLNPRSLMGLKLQINLLVRQKESSDKYFLLQSKTTNKKAMKALCMLLFSTSLMQLPGKEEAVRQVLETPLLINC